MKNRIQLLLFALGMQEMGRLQYSLYSAHIEMLEHLLGALRIIKAQQEATTDYQYPQPAKATHLIN
ncbi:hypothetical protein [Okeania sp. KiyG1]|uniref:hypothetical protein n=1 Tax=Okeania sp. KiyG1 TaxID=2720165 RepID=UPI001F3FD098|nr:hypothetical protein [Okeania sp. KiyG1]